MCQEQQTELLLPSAGPAPPLPSVKRVPPTSRRGSICASVRNACFRIRSCKKCNGTPLSPASRRVLHTKKKPLHVRHEGPEFPEHPSPLTDGFLTLPSLWADNPSAYSSSHPHGTSSPAPGSSLSLSHVFLLLSFGSLKVYGSIILRLCPSWLPLDRLPEWPRSRPWPQRTDGT